MSKGLLALVATALFYGLWYRRKAGAKDRLREIDEGRRCVSCDGTNLARQDGKARCLKCGYTVSLAQWQAVQVSEREIANVTRPDDARR